MKILICGAGLAGYDMARYLARAKHDVTVVDKANFVTERLSNSIDVRCVEGNAAHPAVLAQAGAKDADMLVAMTANDEINMVACQVAHTLFGVSTTIARVREPNYLDDGWSDLFTEKGLPIDAIVSPEQTIAKVVDGRLAAPDSFDAMEFGDGLVQLLGLVLPDDCPVVDTSLRHLTELFPTLGATVVGIERHNQISVPKPDEEMLAGDKIWIVMASKAQARTLKVFGQGTKPARQLVLLGAGRLSQAVARLFMHRRDVQLHIIEEKVTRCQQMSALLGKRHRVECGSIFSAAVQQWMDISQPTEFLALTGNDQVNILASLMMRQRGCRRVLCAFNDEQFWPVSDVLGVANIVSPRSITTSSILKHVRKGRIAGVYALADGRAEITEGEVSAQSQLCKTPLRDVKFPKTARIGAIMRGKDVLAPRGDTQIQAGDHVIMFGLASAQDSVTKYLAGSGDFF